MSAVISNPSGRSVHCSENFKRKSLEYFLPVTAIPSIKCSVSSKTSSFGVDMSAASSQSSSSALFCLDCLSATSSNCATSVGNGSKFPEAESLSVFSALITDSFFSSGPLYAL
ncbi:hypothetical protein V8G54_019931 [Vigna mungo]|uniref:Uncharacterized protein n=1 Tax=Vigna mungo TaxID=3915 RepID=A0AAQ3NAT0_VIGMU